MRAGDFLYVSGQPGIDPDSGQPACPSTREQARQAMRNVESVLRAGGSRPELVVNMTVLVANTADFAVADEIFAETFPVDPPTTMMMQVPLPQGLLISLDCIAIVAPA